MNRLTKFALAATAAFTVCSTLVFADDGIFGDGVVVSLSIGGVSSLDLFETSGIGDSQQAPANPGDGGVTLGSPTPITTGGWSSTYGSGFSLGTFNVATGDTLTLDGGEVLTFKNNNDDDSNVTGGNVGYSINGGSFTEKGLSFNEDNVNGSTGDQRWYSDTAINTNVLNNLPNGTYALSVYYHATTNDGDKYDNNGGGNYNATFTVVPEPSTIMMMLSSGLFGSFYLLRRKRK